VDDHPAFRCGLRHVINGQPDLMVCGEAEDRTTALAGITRHRPSLAVVDLRLRHSSGLDLLADLQAQLPGLATLMMSGHEEVEWAVRSFQAGANGFVLKHEPLETLLHALRHVLDGGHYVSPALAGTLAARYARHGAAASSLELLSNREREVFELLGAGCETAAIAKQMHVSHKTVHGYQDRMKVKLCVPTERALLVYAVAHRERCAARLCRDGQ
jgi:DNA-binding NarL/FixJ family response regulator